MRITILALILVLSTSLVQGQTTPTAQSETAADVFTELGKQVNKLQRDLDKKSVVVSHPARSTSAQTSSVPSAQSSDVVQKAKSTSRTSQLKALLKRTVKNVEELRKFTRKKEIPEDYSESIREYTRRIEFISDKEMISYHDELFLNAVNADLEVKRIHAEKMPENAFDSIKVIVHTKKDGAEKGVYQVWWVKDAYKDETGQYRTFDRFSTPTSRSLPPGKYVMWTKATDGTQATGEKTPKEFGDGQAEVEIDLIAP